MLEKRLHVPDRIYTFRLTVYFPGYNGTSNVILSPYNFVNIEHSSNNIGLAMGQHRTLF